MNENLALNEKDLKKWTTDRFTDRPFLTTWIGAWLIFFGVTVLLISSLFLEYRPKRADWTSLWGMVSVMVGGTMFSASTFINQPILISLGGIFLTLGLVLYMTYLAWKLHDDYDYTSSSVELQHRAEHRGILGMIAMVTVLVGVCFFIKKSIQRFIRPYFGPNNFFLYGPMTFGAGAFVYFLLNVQSMADVNSNEFHPISESSRFGGYLFSAGAFTLLLATSRSFYSYDLLIVPSFPSIVDLSLSSLEALGLSIATAIMSLGGFLFVLGHILLSHHNQDRMITATSCMLSIGYLSIAIILSCKVNRSKPTVVFGRLSQSFAFIVYALGTALKFGKNEKKDTYRLDYAQDLRSAGMAIGIIGTLIVFVTVVKYASPQLLSPGNFSIHGDLFSFAGYFTLFLKALAASDHKSDSCTIACKGSQNLGAIFFSMASFMYFFYFILCLDLATIFDPIPKNINEFIIRLNIPMYLSYLNRLFGLSYTMPSSLSSTMVETNIALHRYSTLEAILFDTTEPKRALDALDALDETIDKPTETENNHAVFDIPSDATVWETTVFIVGCGPTGLTLANEVGQRNIDVTIIDSRLNVLPDSRFFNLLYTTTEGLKRIGVLDKIFARSIPQWFGHGSVSTTGLTHSEAKVIADTSGPGRAIQQYLGHKMSKEVASTIFTSKYAETMSQRCMQSTQETCLKERAEECSQISVRYGWELVSFYDSSNNSNKSLSDTLSSTNRTNKYPVVAMIRNVITKEIVYVKSSYMIGCDGPSSLVSKILKVKFDGYANLGQTRTIHIKTRGLRLKIKPLLGEVLQYHVVRPGYGVGWFVLNYFAGEENEDEKWTFFLMGLSDGRQPRQLSKEDMIEVVREFIGPNITFEVVSDAPWFWNLFFARRIVYNRIMICGDACHSWPPFGGIGGNTGYADAVNLGWKIAAVVHGWGHEGMLTSYDSERRQFGLKTIMVVLNFAPDRSQILRLAQIIKYPWLWWTIRYRWIFASRGSHAGNHYSTDGLFLGARYSSNIIYTNQDHQGIPSLECPPSKYTPSLSTGGRLPHIRFLNNKTLFESIAFDGYTLVVVDPTNLQVKDIILNRNKDLEANHTLSTKGDRELLMYPAIEELCRHFHDRNIPLTIAYIKYDTESITDPSQQEVLDLYKKQHMVLVRPDLYITWNLLKKDSSCHVNVTTEISSFELLKVAQISCSEIYDEKEVLKTKQMNAWLTKRFISNIQGYKHLHRQAIYFENEDKANVIQSIVKQTQAQGGPTSSISLVTKAALWESKSLQENNVDKSSNSHVDEEKQKDSNLLPKHSLSHAESTSEPVMFDKIYKHGSTMNYSALPMDTHDSSPTKQA